MDLNTEYVNPVQLTGFVRAALADLQINEFTLSRWLPNITIEDIVFRATRGQGGLAKTAKFRSYNTESPISGREGLQRLMGELPPISEKRLLEELTRIRMRGIQNQNDSVLSAIYDDVVHLVRAISARVELARGEAMWSGKMVINENGVSQTIDYGRGAQFSVVPSISWGSANATPLADLLAWKAVYKSKGSVMGTILASEQVIQILMRNAEFRALVATTAGTPSIVSVEGVNSALVAFGLPRIESFDAQVEVDDVATRIIPADKLLMLPPPNAAPPQAASGQGPAGQRIGALGSTTWGITAESLSPAYQLVAGSQGGIVAGVYEDPDPVALWTKGSAIVLPVLGNPDLSMCADVL